MQSIYNTNPISWLLWIVCLVIGIVCLRPQRGASAGLGWANPKTAFGFAFLLFHVLRPLYLLITGDYYGARLGFYGFAVPEDINPMLLASALGGLCFLAGWHWSMRRAQSRTKSGKTIPSEHEASLSSTAVVLKRAFVLLPVVALAFVMGRRGNVSLESVNLYYLLRSSLIAVTYLFVVGGVRTRNRGLFGLARLQF